MPAPRSIVCALALLACGAVAAPVSAQLYTGTFTVPNDVGGVMTLTLQESGGGVIGTLSSNGVTFDVKGMIEDGTLVGRMTGPDGSLHFAAERWEDELWLELYGSDASGQPDYDDYTEIDFVLAGSAGASDRNPAAGSTPAERSRRGKVGAISLASRPFRSTTTASGFTRSSSVR